MIAASPCTAPFMGAALGLALTQSAAAALAVFAALGLAWRCPTCCWRGFPKWLDKPAASGTVDGQFQTQVLAFPMFVTVVWLVGASLQAGADGAGDWACWAWSALRSAPG